MRKVKKEQDDLVQKSNDLQQESIKAQIDKEKAEKEVLEKELQAHQAATELALKQERAIAVQQQQDELKKATSDKIATLTLQTTVGPLAQVIF